MTGTRGLAATRRWRWPVHMDSLGSCTDISATRKWHREHDFFMAFSAVLMPPGFTIHLGATIHCQTAMVSCLCTAAVIILCWVKCSARGG
ncbi:hypothetical protein N658DRAFT_248343 [Parathielavia hyrcaniae]|uniref:Uncharacterized protein n=1 Tax=Parathielavia hyrcaniae TaxID=113614 RepID=A0AAN6Q660_9PEZI|nr:hypothetical protein N658DRAFT_248343 [Parathielavia hyrcaniae]